MISEETKLAMIERRKAGATWGQIAREFNVTKGQVAGIMHRAGMGKPKPSKPKEFDASEDPEAARALTKAIKETIKEDDEHERRTLSDPTQSAWRGHVRRRVKVYDWER